MSYTIRRFRITIGDKFYTVVAPTERKALVELCTENFGLPRGNLVLNRWDEPNSDRWTIESDGHRVATATIKEN